jgi:cephalosporin hydroxylase
MTTEEVRPVTWATEGVRTPQAEEIVDRFHRLYCQSGKSTWRETSWLGVPVIKCPLDLWIYHELLFRLRPDVIVETGTHRGGSALFLASMCDLIGSGRIITIDIREITPRVQASRPEHPRITYLTGSSTDPAIVSGVTNAVSPGDTTLVLLDSGHERDHVLAEMRAYAPLVSEGSYMVVEDTNLNGWTEWGPGPLEAVEDFVAEDDRFVVDRRLEKYFMTFNPSGYLRRLPDARVRERRETS